MLSARLLGHHFDVATFYTVKGYEREATVRHPAHISATAPRG